MKTQLSVYVYPGVIHVNDTDGVIASTASHHSMYSTTKGYRSRDANRSQAKQRTGGEEMRGETDAMWWRQSSHVRDAYSSVHANGSSYFFAAIPIVSNVGN